MQKKRSPRRPTITGKASRRKKTGLNLRGRVTVIVLLLGAAAYVLAAGRLGGFIADKVLTPILGAPTDAPGATDIVLAVDTPAPDKTPDAQGQTGVSQVNVVRDVTFPQMDYHALQMGAFSTEEAAQDGAMEVRAIGGAGYIVSDVRYRVLANVYLNGDDARAVKKNLMDNQGVDSYVYSGSVGALELTVTAPQGRIDAIVSGYDAWRRMLTLLGQVSDLVDRGEMTPADAAAELLAQCELLDAAAAKLTDGAQVEDANSVLSGLGALLESTASGARGFCEKNVEDPIAFSADIKYNYVEAVFRYKGYIEGISANMI